MLNEARNPSPAPVRVSVIIPFLDAERFLEEAVRSVLAQTYSGWELLLVDDGSHDRSTAIARQFAAAQPDRIRYLKHPDHEMRGPRGPSASRNLAIAHARGEYVAFLDADDIWLPEKLERQVPLLDRHPDVAMVYGPLHFWYGWTGNPADAERDFISGQATAHDTIVPPPVMLLRQIEKRDGLPGTCSVLIRRSVVERIGGFESSFQRLYEDEVFFSKIALREPVYVMSACLDRYRQHPDSRCARAIQRGEYDTNPKISNQSRGNYLRWLSSHLDASGVDHERLRRALDVELRPYRNPATR
jgi:glycosyltransferase involved in cell wall biosynthesis